MYIGGIDNLKKIINSENCRYLYLTKNNNQYKCDKYVNMDILK